MFYLLLGDVILYVGDHSLWKAYYST